MAHPMSAFGLFHTVLSLAPIAAGAWAFLSHGRIDPATGAGKAYWIGMLASILTAFGLSSTGGFNPGHALGILALLAMLAGTLAPRLRWLGAGAAYIQIIAMSFSFMLLLVPGTNETLSRLPAGHPIASGPDSPVVQAALGGVFVLFLLGTSYQLWRLRASRLTST